MRHRKRDRHLPECVYQKHGAYYLVKRGKWTRLGYDLGTALAAYAQLVGTPGNSMSSLLDRVIADAAGRVKPSTLEQYRVAANKLKKAFREFDVAQVQPKHIAQVMDHHRDIPAMANRMRTVLKLAFNTAIRAGIVPANPVGCIPPHKARKRDRYLTDAEYSAILDAGSPVLRAIIELCYLTAQRIGDVLAIELHHLTDDGILFAQQKTGKKILVRWNTDLRRVVSDARGRIVERKIARLDAPRYILGQRNGKIRSYRGVRDLWFRACVRAGVDDAHIHDLRAKSLTDARRQGLDAQHLAGHSTEAMTVRYLRDREPDLVDGPMLKRTEK